MSTTALRFLQQENARLQEENRALQQENLALRRYMSALKDLSWATQQITAEADLFELLDQILYNAMSVVEAEGGSLLLRDDDTDELVFVVVHGDVSDRLRGYRLDSAVGIAGWVAAHREPLIVNDPRQDQRFFIKVDETFSYVTRSILCVPMMAHGKLIGVIQLLNKQGDEAFV
ncbi:MAG: GAF domain-containing protein, partial [Chloroflexota bacterium]